MNHWFAGLVAFAWCTAAAAQTSKAAIDPLPEITTGRIERLENFPSRHVASRHIDVWLPASYNPTRRYQVLYMHDGQNLFDGKLNWTMKSWRADQAVSNLMKRGQIEDTLIVGIWNSGNDRYAEYYPQKFLAFAPDAVRIEYETVAANGKLRSDAYLKFIVEELKPAIDRKYPTKPGPQHTYVAGSSMGGLISLYSLVEYPQVFGGAAGLSTHWVGPRACAQRSTADGCNGVSGQASAGSGHASHLQRSRRRLAGFALRASASNVRGGVA